MSDEHPWVTWINSVPYLINGGEDLYTREKISEWCFNNHGFTVDHNDYILAVRQPAQEIE